MKKRLVLILALSFLAVAVAFSAKPRKIIGPGEGSANFRKPYHQLAGTTVTLYRDTVYILTGWYFVDSTATLNIQAGTLIYGDTASASTLIIKRGAKIYATGTANAPIVFTSPKAPGNRAPGDWGGVIILGKAPTNQSPDKQIEGGFGEIPDSYAGYGGNDPNDNSGIFQYVRIEFAGIAFSQDNESNGLTLGGVGAGTTISHVQVSYGQDDDFEFFGGTVNAKYLVGWRNIDDNFDTDFGYSGKLQFLYTKRDPNLFDASPPGTSNGMESDNTGTSPFIAWPKTSAKISNWTLVGPAPDTTTTINSKWSNVAMLRRNTGLSIFNSVMFGWHKGIEIRDTVTQRNIMNDTLQLRYISMASKYPGIVNNPNPGLFNVLNWFGTPSFGNIGILGRQPSEIGLPSEVFNLNQTNNPVPPLNSEPAIAGTGFDGRLSGDSWFDQVSYRGAFVPGVPMNQQWTAGWTNFEPENYNPEAITVTNALGTPWNIVSVPVQPSSYEANSLFPGKSGMMFAFSTTTQGYVASPTLSNGQGYWVKYTSSTNNSITGSYISGTSITVAQAGWVLVGSISKSINTNELTTIPAGAITGSAFRFNPISQSFNVATTINPGEAVWVKVKQACTIVFPN